MALKNRTSCLVAIGCFALLLALAAMAIQRARIQALKMSSSNTLRQIGLGLMNFESAYKRLPEGCDLEAKHGWMTRIQPQMESSPWYGSIYQDEAWDHPSNAHKFRIRNYNWERPGAAEVVTEEGFGLTHYLANPSVLHRESKVRFSEIESGIANTWFVGEVSGKYQPYGYPFNWRALTWPLNDGHGGYGGAEIIAKFDNIEALVAGRLLLTKSGIQALTSLPHLKSILCIEGDEEAANQLKFALPNCVVHFRKY